MFGRNRTGYDYLIVGLGNPGTKYDGTRHNVGFSTLDALADDLGCSVTKSKYKALYGDAYVGGKRCILCKPQTFMNLSGEAVVPLAKFYKIPIENIIVISDDVSLDVGQLRVRRKGSDGGHNGLKNIILQSGSDNFPRVKIGCGKKPHPDYDMADWVLSKFSRDDAKIMGKSVKDAAEAVKAIITDGVDKAMNNYNR